MKETCVWKSFKWMWKIIIISKDVNILCRQNRKNLDFTLSFVLLSVCVCVRMCRWWWLWQHIVCKYLKSWCELLMLVGAIHMILWNSNFKIINIQFVIRFYQHSKLNQKANFSVYLRWIKDTCRVRIQLILINDIKRWNCVHFLTV